MRAEKHNCEERGFSLIEVLIAILILTVGLLTLAQVMVIATNANALSGRMTASAALAKEQLELLKAAPFYTNPASITMFNVRPNNVITRNVPITEIGMATATIPVADPLRRNTSSTTTARMPPTTMFLTTRSIADSMYTVSS